MPIKRRAFISLGMSGLATAIGWRYLSGWPQKNSTISITETAFPVEEAALLNFIVAGDVGTGKRAQYAVARAMARRWHSAPFSLALFTGDNIYEDGDIERIEEVFERPYAELLQNGVVFYTALGNHDIRTNNGNDQVAYSGYNMAAKYYTFVEQSVQFFALDTNQAHLTEGDQKTQWDTQLRWLRTELEQSLMPWKVVFAHHPIYSSGWHGSDSNLERDLSPLFSEYGVQLYINGHDHNYERTEPINGTTYITAGNGAKLRPVSESSWTAYASSQLGFTTFDVHPDQLIIRAIDTHNNVYDEAMIRLPG